MDSQGSSPRGWKGFVHKAPLRGRITFRHKVSAQETPGACLFPVHCICPGKSFTWRLPLSAEGPLWCLTWHDTMPLPPIVCPCPCACPCGPLLAHQMRKHEVVADVSMNRRCVDGHGCWWTAPHALALDLASLGTWHGLRYRLGLHHVGAEARLVSAGFRRTRLGLRTPVLARCLVPLKPKGAAEPRLPGSCATSLGVASVCVSRVRPCISGRGSERGPIGRGRGASAAGCIAWYARPGWVVFGRGGGAVEGPLRAQAPRRGVGEAAGRAEAGEAQPAGPVLQPACLPSSHHAQRPPGYARVAPCSRHSRQGSGCGAVPQVSLWYHARTG